MASSTITPQDAWALCDWVDKDAQGPPPSPWTIAFLPDSPKDPSFAVLLQNSNQYALAIRGTQNGWDVVMDLDIGHTPDFPEISGAQVAQGALFSMDLTLKLKRKVKIGHEKLEECLKLIDWSKNSLFLTGHSLGGTVASLLAPWAAVNLFRQNEPLQQLPAGIQATTFAAFAAGNQEFATFLNNQTNYQANCNLNDVVPHVWAMQGQYSVPHIYGMWKPAPHMPLDLKLALDLKVKRIPAGFNYVQTNIVSFTYPVDPSLSWKDELAYQHNDAYIAQFGQVNETVAAAEG
jgi:hypothetical protein